MKLEEFINTYNGQIVRGGQCGELVRQYWIDVDQTVPPSYENSKDYWFNPVPGYDKVATPQPGDIAIYNGHGAYPEGHSAIYVDGRVFEQNADPNGSPAHLFNRNSPYLLGYLRKQGKEENDMPNDGDVDNVYLEFNGRKATDDEKKVYTEKSWSAGDGLYYGKVAVEVANLKKALDEARNSSYKPLGKEVFVKE